MRRLRDDLTPLLLRIAAGMIFVPHGFAKVFGSGGAAAFAHDMPAYGVPVLLGYVAAYAEFFGAILLVAGLFTRLDALLLAGTMAVATFVVQLPDALHDVEPGSITMFAVMKGIELPLSLLAATLAIALLGPGRISLDALLGIEARAMRLLLRRESAVPAASAI